MANKSKWVKGDRVYSQAFCSNATVVAVDMDGPKPIYIIKIDGSDKDCFNILEKNLRNAK